MHRVDFAAWQEGTLLEYRAIAFVFFQVIDVFNSTLWAAAEGNVRELRGR